MYLQSEIMPGTAWLLKWLPSQFSLLVKGHVKTIEEYVNHADEVSGLEALTSSCQV